MVCSVCSADVWCGKKFPLTVVFFSCFLYSSSRFYGGAQQILFNVWCGKKWRPKTLFRGQNLEIRKWKWQFISETSKRTKWYTTASKELLQSPKIGAIKHTLEDQLQNQKIESVNSYQNPQRETKWYTATEKEPPQTKMLGGKWQMKAHLNYYLLTKWNRQRICEPCISCIILFGIFSLEQPSLLKSNPVFLYFLK